MYNKREHTDRIAFRTCRISKLKRLRLTNRYCTMVKRSRTHAQSYSCMLLTQTLPGYRLLTAPFGYEKPSGYASRLVAKVVCLQKPSDYESRLVTKAALLRKPAGYDSYLDTTGCLAAVWPAGYDSRLDTSMAGNLAY